MTNPSNPPSGFFFGPPTFSTLSTPANSTPSQAPAARGFTFGSSATPVGKPDLKSIFRRRTDDDIDFHLQVGISRTAALLDSGDYSDLIIRCEGKDFRVHKNIVCPESPVLAAEIKYDTKERQSGIIEHVTFDAATVQRMLSYMYKRSYTVGAGKESKKYLPDNALPTCSKKDTDPKDEQATTNSGAAHADLAQESGNIIELYSAHAKVYAIADYYQVADLKSLAAQKFSTVELDSGLKFTAAGFIDVVSEVCTNAPSTRDKLLTSLLNLSLGRSHILYACNEFTEGLTQRPEVQAFVARLARAFRESHASARAARTSDKQHFEATISALERTAATWPIEKKNFQDTIAALQQTVTQHETEIATLNQTIATVKEELEHEDRVANFLEQRMSCIANGLKNLSTHCRGCRRDISHWKSCTIEETKDNDYEVAIFGVRCAYCKCRLVGY